MAKILLIEDNLGIRENTTELLELGGYDVISAENGIKGFELLEIHADIEIVICDIQMPEMNGHEVLTKLKSSPSMKHIDFIYLTASAEPSEIEHGLLSGASAYISKPFEFEELNDAIQSCLKA